MKMDLKADLLNRYPRLESVQTMLDQALEILIDSYQSGGKVLTCGNGGSSSDADHIVGELVKSFSFKRGLPEGDLRRLQSIFSEEEAEYIGDQLEGALPAINLMSSMAFNTAYANDVTYEFAVAQHLYALGSPGDVLIAISTSGNSKNIIRACQVARLKGIRIIGLSGQSGGLLSEFADVMINVSADKVHEIQELHLPVYHYLCKCLEDKFFHEKRDKTSLKPETNSQKPRVSVDKDVGTTLKLIVFDFDGVFTDNQVITSETGLESVVCNKSDSLSLEMAKSMNVKLLVLSKERNPVVFKRCEKLGIELIQGCDEKLAQLKNLANEMNLESGQIGYMGNDLNDLECLSWVGFPIAVADAIEEVKQVARYCTPNPGGRGAVRDALNYLKRRKLIC